MTAKQFNTFWSKDFEGTSPIQDKFKYLYNDRC